MNTMNDNIIMSVSEQEIRDFLKEEVEKHCNENGEYEIYFDYRETLSEDFLMKAFNEYSENRQGYEKFEDYLDVRCYDEWLGERNWDFADIVKEDAVKEGYEFAARLEEYLQGYDYEQEAFEEVGYHGITYDFGDLLKQDYHLNIMLGTDMEQNYDMGSIPSIFNNMGDTPYFEDEIDNALTYLIHQQGYEVAEVVAELKKGEDDMRSDSSFIRSVAEEISEMPAYSMMELTVSVSGSGRELLEVLDKIAKKEGSIEISKDSSVGLFNEWLGTCSQLDIKLEQPAVIPVDMIRNMQIERAGDENYGYTVSKVCDLSGSFWKGEVSTTNEQPELIHEDISAIMEAFRNDMEKQAEIDR